MTQANNLPPTPPEAGKSSFSLLDFDAFTSLVPKKGVQLAVDLGCGYGAYALPLARMLGPGALVVGVDLWAEGLETLKKNAASEGLANVHAMHADIPDVPALGDGVADLVLMATVLHDLTKRKTGRAAMAETARIMAPGGRFLVVEFKKEETPHGPPVAVRLSLEALKKTVPRRDFTFEKTVDAGPELYAAVFVRNG